jgi:hypothetical protein
MTNKRMLAVTLAAVCTLVVAPAQAEIKKDWVDYTHGGMKLKAYLVHDDSVQGKRPAVLMIHAREGMTPKTQQLAEIWAKFGYAVFAADMFGYGQGILPKNVEEMSVQTEMFRKDRGLARTRTQAGFDAMAKLPMVDTRPASPSSAIASAAPSASSLARRAHRSR